jgi:hypothetical protein
MYSQNNEEQIINSLFGDAGTNLDVLRMFPFERCLPRCFCIEHERKWIDVMSSMLKIHGYQKLAVTGENLIVAKENV